MHAVELRSIGNDGRDPHSPAILAAQLRLLILQHLCGQADTETISASATVIDLLFNLDRYDEARQHLQGHMALLSHSITSRCEADAPIA